MVLFFRRIKILFDKSKFLKAAEKAGVRLVDRKNKDKYNVIFEDGSYDFIDPTFDIDLEYKFSVDIKNIMSEKIDNSIVFSHQNSISISKNA